MATDKIENVGIKESQKQEIEDLIRKTDKYKSINEVVQTAVIKLLNSEKQETKTTTKNVSEVLKKISSFCERLLEEEFSEKIKLTNELIRIIETIQYEIRSYNRQLFSTRTDKLLISRSLKKYFDDFIQRLENDNKEFKLNISKERINELNSLRQEFIDTVISKG